MRRARSSSRAAARSSASSATSSSSSAAAAHQEARAADRRARGHAARRASSPPSSSTTTSSATRRKPRSLLRDLDPWQEKHNYPLRLSTEASINLADDPELLELMYEANFRSVFIGIETPREASLKETKKFQNTRGDSLEAKLERDPERRARHQRRVHRRLRQRRPGDLRGPVPLHPGQRRSCSRWWACSRRSRRRRSTSGSRRRDASSRKTRTATSFPQADDARRAARGYWDLVGRLYTPEAFFDRYFSVYRLTQSRVRARAPRSASKAGEGKMLPTLGYGLILALVSSLEALRTRRVATERRPRLPALLLQA